MKSETICDRLSFFTDKKTAHEAYLKDGYFIEYDIFSKEECELFIHESASLENAIKQTYTPQMMPHRTNSYYLNGIRNEKIVAIMDILLNGTAVGLQTEFFFCKPGTRGFSLHQDNFFVQAPIGAFASAWVALTDTHKDKGGLIVYPGTHVEGELPVRKLNLVKDSSQDPNANNEETIVPKKYSAITACVPRGAVLFIHGHLVHGSNPNITSEWRYVLLNTFIRAGEPFRPGNYAQREPINLR